MQREFRGGGAKGRMGFRSGVGLVLASAIVLVVGAALVQGEQLSATDTQLTVSQYAEPYKLSFMEQLSEVPSLKSTATLKLSMVIGHADSAEWGEGTDIEATFLELRHVDSGIRYMTQGKVEDNNHVFSVQPSKLRKKLNGQGGLCVLTVVAGDSKADESFKWELGSIDVTTNEKSESLSASGKKQDMTYTFRGEEKIAPSSLSSAFTLLVIGCLPMLVILFGMAGASLKSFPKSVYAAALLILFHTSLCGLVFLLTKFFLELDTPKYVPICGLGGLVAAVVGHQALSQLALDRIKSNKAA